MNTAWNELQTAFVNDHIAMTHGYRDLLEAVQSGDFESASRLASDLDKVAGPHIEFEETCLYPEVEESRGETYTARLYDEHAEILRAVVELQSLSDDAKPTKRRVKQWQEQLQHGLDHAAACGSLLSHLGTQSADQQQSLLNTLLLLRQQGRRWSELHPSLKDRD
ncbi:hemerythrin domain-containing protein [Rubripirellula reticaptiva]|uniref:DNA nickase n=1 Tax=Rubripirellula reticaptiva TaxID=2528013 RepID=A0A5C6F5T2_9BACT|nr:hemerythrin domain-containing protein [Rubripirellula reticaptiva]TWU55884.1 DNA nickase [Rubripirellula reticaptiva]